MGLLFFHTLCIVMELSITANSGIDPELRCSVISMIDTRFNDIKEPLLISLLIILINYCHYSVIVAC